MTVGIEGTTWRERIDGFKTETASRARFMATPEVALGAVIVVFWAVVATLTTLPLPLMVLAVIVGVALHLAAVDSGNFVVLGAATGFVLLLIIASARSLLAEADPLVYALAGSSALVHNETVRIGYARRRRAVVDAGARVASVVGIGLATLVAVIGIGVSEPLAETVGQRSWLWMPAAVGVVALVIIGFAVVPTIGAPDAAKERWRPGDRLPPARFDVERTNHRPEDAALSDNRR